MIIFYSTHCPKCNVLSKKMDMAGVQYITNDSTKDMLAKGIKSAPCIEMEDGKILNFSQAISWLKTLNV